MCCMRLCRDTLVFLSYCDFLPVVFSAASFSLPWQYHILNDAGRCSSLGSRGKRSLVTIMLYSHPNWAIVWCPLLGWPFFKQTHLPLPLTLLKLHAPLQHWHCTGFRAQFRHSNRLLQHTVTLCNILEKEEKNPRWVYLSYECTSAAHNISFCDPSWEIHTNRLEPGTGQAGRRGLCLGAASITPPQAGTGGSVLAALVILSHCQCQGAQLVPVLGRLWKHGQRRRWSLQAPRSQGFWPSCLAAG